MENNPTTHTEEIEEALDLKDEYRFVKKIGSKLIYAHTTYHEIEEPDYEQFVTEDDTPVDNLFSEIQQRLLISPLHANQWTDRDFWASSNVGIYYAIDKPAIIPDMFLSFDVKKPNTWVNKKDKCYFTWVVGKSPELVVEVISNKIGKENSEKMDIYAQLGVLYYILIDPFLHLYPKTLNVFYLGKARQYVPLENEFCFMEEVSLGIRIWEGLFEGESAPWGRWCSKEGNVLLTGAERAEEERQRAEEERQRAEKAEADVEKERQRVEKLLAKLKALGLTPDEEI